MTPFDAGMSFVWRPENDGQPLHYDPRDPGGATSWGMTFTLWASWQRHHGMSSRLEDFRLLPRTAFLPIYRMWFWQAVRGDEMNPAIAVTMLDVAVLSSPLRAVEFLQTVLGIEVDGLIGPQTMLALRGARPREVVTLLCSEREAFYSRSPNFRIYGHGWDRRAEDCRAFALSMIDPPAVSAAVPASPAALTADDLNAAQLAKLKE